MQSFVLSAHAQPQKFIKPTFQEVRKSAEPGPEMFLVTKSDEKDRQTKSKVSIYVLVCFAACSPLLLIQPGG